MNQIPRSKYTLKPWKNGLGMTEEIYVFPEGKDEFLFRLSMAALSQSGPFSSFPGVDRSLILLEGKPVKLNEQLVPLLSPVNFPGEDKIFATVEAEGRDLNLMWRRGKVSAQMMVLSGEAIFPEASDVCIVFALSDSVMVGKAELRKYDSCILETGDKKTTIKGEQFLRVDISYI